MFKNKSILITGGTGSFGKRFVSKMLSSYPVKRIVVFSRDELKQFEFQNELEKVFGSKLVSKKVRFFIGDIRDKDRLSRSMKDINYCVHAAALKQVTTAEYNPFEAVKTNILGGQNIIDSALSNGLQKVIALSTDKAAAPVNLYGATKLTSDKLFISANNYKGKANIQFSVVRYGNVMGSRGSVIPFFINRKDSNELPVTDKRMTRFNISLDEGVQFVIDSFGVMMGGELFVPKLPSYNIIDLAKAIAPKAKIKIIGIREGEKLHEEMITAYDAPNTVEHKNKYVVLPNSKYINWGLKEYKKRFKSIKLCKEGFSYNSYDNENYLSVSKLRKILKIENLIK
tara:strand:+ start:1079 stop:2101 length:1023 start_codon:yes stop_codon:yes gene_type:complete